MRARASMKTPALGTHNGKAESLLPGTSAGSGGWSRRWVRQDWCGLASFLGKPKVELHCKDCRVLEKRRGKEHALCVRTHTSAGTLGKSVEKISAGIFLTSIVRGQCLSWLCRWKIRSPHPHRLSYRRSAWAFSRSVWPAIPGCCTSLQVK